MRDGFLDRRDATVMASYPEVFGAGMPFGFEVGDGWRPIVLRLADDLAKLLAEDPLPGFQITQVKEKWGELRVYATMTTEPLQLMIDAAEELALEVCMACGKPGRLRCEG